MTGESWKGVADVVLIGAGLLAAAGATTPLWWQNLLTSYCRSQHGLTDTSCSGAIGALSDACQNCDSYGLPTWVPFLAGLGVGLLAFVAKFKDSLSF